MDGWHTHAREEAFWCGYTLSVGGTRGFCAMAGLRLDVAGVLYGMVCTGMHCAALHDDEDGNTAVCC